MFVYVVWRTGVRLVRNGSALLVPAHNNLAT